MIDIYYYTQYPENENQELQRALYAFYYAPLALLHMLSRSLCSLTALLSLTSSPTVASLFPSSPLDRLGKGGVIQMLDDLDRVCKTLVPSVSSIREFLKGKKCRKMDHKYHHRVISNFDNGYFRAANLQYLGTNWLDGYIADSKQAQEMKVNKPKMSPYSKDSFD